MLTSSYRGSIAGAVVADGYLATIDGMPGGPPLAHWRLGEANGTQIIDRKPGARHGTYAGTIGYGVAGLPQDSDNAADFGGTGTGEIPHDAGLQLSAFSLSFWFRVNSLPPDADPNETLVLVAKDASGLNWGDVSVYVSEDASLNIQVQSASASFSITAPDPMEIDTTYHLAVRADNTGFDAYLNGRYLGKNTGFTDALASNTQPLQFGSAGWAIVDADAVLDEVALYDRVLTEAEAIELSQVTAAPVAVDGSAGVPESATTPIDVVANDTWVGSKAGLTVEIMSQPSGGDSVAVDGNNDLAYTAGAVSADTPRSFTYRITDPNGTSNIATVNVTVQDAGGQQSPLSNCFIVGGQDTVEVSSMAALESAVNAASPGRQILIAPGTYSGGNLDFTGNGTEANPIVIRPRDGLGTVTINTARWALTSSSSRLVFTQLFHNGALIEIFGLHQRISRCQFRQIDVSAIPVRAAVGTRIDHCDFSDYIGTNNKKCIQFEPDGFGDGTNAPTLIDYNYFHDITPSVGGNGNEIIGWNAAGGSNMDLGPAGAIGVVDHCLFKNIDIPDEGEFISLKAGGWRVSFCTFEIMGHYLQPRTGNNCEFRSNWFEAMPSHCLNIWGDDHLVIGNRFVGNLNMRIGSGNATSDELIAGTVSVNSYACSRNGRFIGNVMGTGAILVGGYWSGDDNDEPAQDNNLYENTGTVPLVPDKETGTTFNVDNEPYTPAVKLTPADVGLSAPDPLCD